jgi:hypothetical protein
VLEAMLAEDVARLVGPKGRHNPARAAVRHGSEPGQVTLGGRRVRIRRPRVRSADGTWELPVPTPLQATYIGFLLKVYGLLRTSWSGRSRSTSAATRTAHAASHRPARIRGHPKGWLIQKDQNSLQDAMSCRRKPAPRPTTWACGNGTLAHRHAAVFSIRSP